MEIPADPTLIGSLAAAMVVVAGGVGAAASKFLNAQMARRIKEQGLAMAGLERVCDRQDKEIGALRKELSDSIVETRRTDALHGECREAIRELYGEFKALHQTACRWRTVLEERGIPVEAMPPLLPFTREPHANPVG